ncbi:diguanylate cyclase domain-containing protein [Flaviflagellibacter deserti]|uniref:Diguanylate cyclase domain-containing protein n=1 Tax=Flaviflagellibacter deserti TaxID=2267266 RepID=A0ABV9YW31_9HYPH
MFTDGVEVLRIPFVIEDHEVFIGASVGFAAMHPDDPMEGDQLLVAADNALYAAKRAGKNTWRNA